VRGIWTDPTHGLMPARHSYKTRLVFVPDLLGWTFWWASTTTADGPVATGRTGWWDYQHFPHHTFRRTCLRTPTATPRTIPRQRTFTPTGVLPLDELNTPCCYTTRCCCRNPAILAGVVVVPPPQAHFITARDCLRLHSAGPQPRARHCRHMTVPSPPPVWTVALTFWYKRCLPRHSAPHTHRTPCVEPQVPFLRGYTLLLTPLRCTTAARGYLQVSPARPHTPARNRGLRRWWDQVLAWLCRTGP